MALIGKIRERAGIAVSIIAGSLLLFIVGGEVMQLMDKSPDQYIGTIAGKKVKYDEYFTLVEKTRQENEMAQNKEESQVMLFEDPLHLLDRLR